MSYLSTVHQLVALILFKFHGGFGPMSGRLAFVGYVKGLLYFTAVPSVRSLRWVPPLLLLPLGSAPPLGLRPARCVVGILIKVIAVLSAMRDGLFWLKRYRNLVRASDN